MRDMSAILRSSHRIPVLHALNQYVEIGAFGDNSRAIYRGGIKGYCGFMARVTLVIYLF